MESPVPVAAYHQMPAAGSPPAASIWPLERKDADEDLPSGSSDTRRGGGRDEAASLPPATLTTAYHAAPSSAAEERAGDVRLPERSTTHVNFHSGGDEELGVGVEGQDEDTVQLSPKDVESSSREPSNETRQYQGVNGSDSSVPARIIAFVNFHSGGKAGEKLAADLVHELGREHVFDLKGDGGPQRGLKQFKGTPGLRVVAGGGDGTINWVLSTMRMEGMTDVPFGCIPLGTGNDFSRAFGWGFKWLGLRKVNQNLERMRLAKSETFMRCDRWHAFAQYDEPATPEWLDSLPASVRAIKSAADLPDFYRHPQPVSLPPVPAASAVAQSELGRPRPMRAATIDIDAREQGYNVQAVELKDRGAPHAAEEPLNAPRVEAGQEKGPGSYFGSEWNNYLSWGVDAQIQGSFHHKRESCRVCFCARPCNMAWMGCLGASNFCCCQSDNLDVSVEVRDDQGKWVVLPLPPGLKSIVLLNTPTYAGGRFLWGRDNMRKPKPPKQWECQPQRQAVDDGLFEIVGMKSTIHLGLIMAQVSRGVRLAQCNEARLTFGSRVWCQADGEPYLDRPATYHIRPLKPALLMTRPERVVHTTIE